MRLLSLILGSVRVLAVRYAADGSRTCVVWRCTAAGMCAEEETDLLRVRGAVVVIVSGHGVVTKPVDSGVASKVSADVAAFVCSESQGMISFVRRDQLRELLDELTAAGIHPQSIGCGEEPAAAAEALFGALRWKMLLRLNAESSALAQAVARRLMIPMLGLFFVMLSVNAMVGPRLQTERQELTMQCEAMRKDEQAGAESSAECERLLRDYTRRPPVGYALLCDRIGLAVPPEVTLSVLEIAPLASRFEEDKPLQRTERSGVVAGRCAHSASIGEFAEALSQLDGVSDVRIVSVARSRDGALEFRIELEL